jgi:hypothetical protein
LEEQNEEYSPGQTIRSAKFEFRNFNSVASAV